jgi:hypothetical protein
MKTETTTSAPKVGSNAIVRHCDQCLAVTAIDLDNTKENASAMRMFGQTVRIVDTEKVKTMQLERCKCDRHEGLHCHVCNNRNPRCHNCGGHGTPWLI